MDTLAIFGARIVFGKMLPHLAYPVLWGPLRGSKFILGSLAGEGGGASVYFNRVEPEQTSVFVRTVRKGMVFFDIGANVGYYSILGARLVGSQGKVFAFEPAIRNLTYLHQHATTNRLKNIVIMAVACSETLSIASFSEGINPATGHLGDGADAHNNLPVLTTSVDEVVEQIGISPDVVKIDVEGAELSVLKGAKNTLRKSRPSIFLSTHSGALRKSCLEYLKDYGYSCEPLSQNKSDPSEFLGSFVGE